MKRYCKIILTAVLGTFIASCDSELKKETTLDVTVLEGENLSSDGTAITVKKNTPVTFSLGGNPDFITFFSGENGHEYTHRERTEMTAADLTRCRLTFSVWAQYGNPKDIVSMYISDAFPGLSKQDFAADSVLVEQFAWSTLVPQSELPQKAVSGAAAATAYDVDLKSYLGKKITLAIRYKGVTNTSPQSKFYFLKTQIEKTYNNGQTETKSANSFGLTPVNMDHKKNFKDQEKAVYRPKATDKEYGYVTGGIAGLWNLSDPTNIFIQSSAKGADLKYTWLVSAPIVIDNRCNPDTGVGIKNMTQSLQAYTYTYKAPGTYTATFVASNANYTHRGSVVVRELTIHVVD